MCGGRGTRLDADRAERGGSDASAPDGRAGHEVTGEKPLVRVGGRPMVDRVRDALAASRAGPIHAVVSPHVPETRAHLADAGGCRLVDAPGEGYVADLGHALDAVGRPALTVAADLPLLAPDPVDRALVAARVDAGDEGDGGADPGPSRDVRSLAVHVPAALKRALGTSVDTTVERNGHTLVPAGLNVVADGPEAVRVSHDARLAVNVNRPVDREVAEELCD
ncbi:MAG: NTP transferase domain-containing protein [Haloferacaceae archaeon]